MAMLFGSTSASADHLRSEAVTAERTPRPLHPSYVVPNTEVARARGSGVALAGIVALLSSISVKAILVIPWRLCALLTLSRSEVP
jgi:hypothetical protein